MSRRLACAVAATVTLGAAAGTTLAGTAGTASTTAGPLPGLMVGKAPWPPNNGLFLKARLRALGLPALSAEGVVQHSHEHLDVLVNGRLVLTPAGIGIDSAGRFIAELHTHDSSGIIHIESPKTQAFTLGQFFGVWGLRFTPTCLGGYCTAGASRVWVFVNGRRFTGDPRAIVLRSHQEIIVGYGTFRSIPKPIPAAFPFPPGL